MNTQFKLFNTDEANLNIVKSLVKIQNCKILGLNTVITVDRQLLDLDINILMERVKNILILTKHCWFSKKQEEDEFFVKKHYPFFLIGNELIKYTQSNFTSNYPARFDDSKYLGYGLKDWSRKNINFNGSSIPLEVLDVFGK